MDSKDDVRKHSSLALDSSDRPRISYYHSTYGNLKFAYLSGTTWQSQTVDGQGNVGEYTSLAIDGRGNLHISYCDTSKQNLKYAKCDGCAKAEGLIREFGCESDSRTIEMHNKIGQNPKKYH